MKMSKTACDVGIFKTMVQVRQKAHLNLPTC
jgi:hypothetical protein